MQKMQDPRNHSENDLLHIDGMQDESPGRRLRQARERRNYSRADVERLTGVPQSSLIAWELGRAPLKRQKPYHVEVVDKLARVLGITPDAIWEVAHPEEVRFVQDVPPVVQRMASGDRVILRGLKGVGAGMISECWFEEVPDMFEVPGFLIVGDPSWYRVVICNGTSMAPRIGLGDSAIIRLSDQMIPNVLSLARSTEGRSFLKVLRTGTDGASPELHSVNNRFPTIPNLTGWTMVGHVVAIWSPSERGSKNIEYDGGVPLRA